VTSAIARTLGRSLGARLFVITGALVLLAILAAVGFTSYRASRVADQWVADVLSASRAAEIRFERQRIAQLRLASRLVAGDPSFVAYVAEGDAASVHDLLLERQRDLQCDFAAVLDRRGRVLARTDRAGGLGEDLARAPLVAEAMRRGDAAGVWSDGERYWTAVAMPLVTGGEVAEGILITGLAIDDVLALDVRRQSGAEVAFAALAPAPRIVASTLGSDQELLAALTRSLGARRPLGGAAGDAPIRLTLDGRHWAMQTAPLTASDAAPASDPTLLAVTLASLDQAQAPFRRIIQALLLVGALSLLVAFPLSYLLSRRITGPLERLADAADAAREGRYETPLPPRGPDEVGRLAGAFRGLLRDLHEQREMAGYLQMLSRSMPDLDPPAPGDGAASPGTVLGDRFEILEWVGAGGMGIVYRARDRQLNEVVALKTLRPERSGAEALEGLKAELRAARRITHRNVLRTHDFGDAGGVAFISMELVRGVTLRELLAHDPKLPISVALRIARQVLSGLEAAHGMGIVHRDIKPENLILEPTGQLKIMDFGIAIASRVPGAEGLGGLSGTLGYLAPEQLAGGRGDARSDIYATAVVLYEMLAGRRPFTASDPAELSYRQMNEDPPSLRDLAPEVPERLADAIHRGLARDPAQRFADACRMQAALAEAQA
jgi:HAMP domain-containing protein